MAFIQDFFTSRGNYGDGDSRIGQTGRLWYDSNTNTIRISDGVTPGGIIVGGAGGGGSYVLPTASTTVKGGVKIDGTTITINDQVISGFSGNYNDLTNKPTIPTLVSQLTNDTGFITSSALSGYATESWVQSQNYLTTVGWNDITGKPTFATVATSGDYNDLINKPSAYSLPIASSSTLGGIKVGTGLSIGVDGTLSVTSTGTNNLTISLIDNNGTLSKEVQNVSALRFDTESAFDLTDLGNGEVKVQMNSTFKYWKVDGQEDLVAVGLDTVQFASGNGIRITTDPNSGPYQKIIFESTFSGSYLDLTELPEQYNFKISADDSTQRLVNQGETIQFLGGTGITTTSNDEGVITISGFSGDYDDLANRPDLTVYQLSSTAFDGDYNSLTNKPDPYTLSVAADDSTQVDIRSGELIKFIGTNGITTSADTEGFITFSGPDLSSYATTSYVTTQITNLVDGAPGLLDTLNELAAALNDDANFASNIANIVNDKLDRSEQYRLFVAADDSTSVEIHRGETIQLVGGTGITTSVDTEGKVTISGFSGNYEDLANTPELFSGDYNDLVNKPDQYKFNIAADDSTQIEVRLGETIKIQGGTGINTTSDDEGNIIVEGFSGDYNDLANTPSIPVYTTDLINDSDFIDSSALNGYATEQFVLDQGYITQASWNITADDSVSRIIHSGETVSFLGTQGITTSSDDEGNITIQGPDLTGYATETYVDTAIENLIDNAPQLLDTLNELAAAIGDDPNFITTVTSGLGQKANISDLAQVAFTGSYDDLTNTPRVAFSVAGDDSTAVEVSLGETIKFSGQQGITTQSDSEGNILIQGPDLSSYATTAYVDQELAAKVDRSELADVALSGDYNDLINQPEAYQFYIGADDSTMTTVTSGNGIKILGGTDIDTASDIFGNITVSFTNSQGYLNSIDLQGTTGTSSYGSGDTLEFTSSNGVEIDVTNDSSVISVNIDTPQDVRTTASPEFNAVTINELRAATTDITVDGNLVPSSANQALGSAATPWKTLYVSGQTINIGGIEIGVENGNLTFGNEVVVTTQLPDYDEIVIANDNDLGVVRIGNNVNIDNQGRISVADPFTFNVTADDSSSRLINNGETVKFVGGVGVDTSIDLEGNVTINGFSGNYNDLANQPALFSGNYDDLSNKPALFSGDYNDLTNRPDVPDSYSFNITADDSTSRPIRNGETVKISGQGGITTYSDSEGHIVIDGPDLAELGDVQIGTNIPLGYVLKWNGTKWAPALDQTSENAGTLQIYDEGSTLFSNVQNINFVGSAVSVTGTLDGVNVNISTDVIGYNIDGGGPSSVYGGINPIDAGRIA